MCLIFSCSHIVVLTWTLLCWMTAYMIYDVHDLGAAHAGTLDLYPVHGMDVSSIFLCV
jgi:hypothetical protein